MRKVIGVIAFAAVISAGAQSSAITPQDPQVYVEPSPSTGGQVIEGKVIRVDADSYVIRDLSGRDMRVYFDPGTKRDAITVGDQVIVRFDRPSAPYAASITRRPSDVTTVPAGALPRRPSGREGPAGRPPADGGRARRVTNPASRFNGSPRSAREAAGVNQGTITSTFSRTNSVANSGRRLNCP